MNFRKTVLPCRGTVTVGTAGLCHPRHPHYDDEALAGAAGPSESHRRSRRLGARK